MRFHVAAAAALLAALAGCASAARVLVAGESTSTGSPTPATTGAIDVTADRHAGTGPPVNHVDCGVVTAIPDPLECAPQS